MWYECPNPRKASVNVHMLLDAGTLTLPEPLGQAAHKNEVALVTANTEACVFLLFSLSVIGPFLGTGVLSFQQAQTQASSTNYSL